MKKGIFFVAIVFICNVVIAQLQAPYLGTVQWVNGYAKDVQGETISYFSAYPDYANIALLTRCTDGAKVIEWETAPVPKKTSGNYIYFSWVAAHSSGTSSGNRNFDLYVNDQKVLTFTTMPGNQLPTWTYAAPDSSRLVFQQTKRDGANDAHGLIFLRLPVARVKRGQFAKIKIVGAAQQSNDWFMTFKFSFEEKADVEPMPFRLKDGKQPVALTVLHFGKEALAHVAINQKEAYSFLCKNGVNHFEIPVNAVQQEDSLQVRVSIGQKILANRYIKLQPVIYRELHLIHHSHTDIGYSHLQPEVLRIQMKNIDDALHMIDKTNTLPDAARFKWNIESLWVVENYLKQASASQKEKFIRAVKEGNICLSGLYANILTGLSEPEEVFHYTDYAAQLREQFGLRINSAMISDIPGYAWTTVTGLAKGGIRYFSSGPNFMGETHPYLGDRAGHFVKAWGDKPVWWTSPSGEEKILFWTAGKGYSSWHGTAIGGVFERGPKKIAAYLNELRLHNYPYDLVQWRYNVVSDNGPIDSTISEFVEQWNNKYASPKIVLNTTEKVFEQFEQKYGASIPVVKGDITPYWEDGALSTAAEEGMNRRNSLRLQQLTNLYAMLAPEKYNPAHFYEAWKNILLFHEHTWGAYNSVSEPDKPFVTEQWRIKKQFLLDAGEQIDQLETGLLNDFVQPGSKKIAVINTSSFVRDGLVVLPVGVTGNSVKDLSGKIFPLQKLSNGSSIFWAGQVPPLGTTIYTITDNKAVPGYNGFHYTDSSVSNGKITLRWDKKGSIIQLSDSTGFNYAETFNGQGLNSFWYVPGLDPAKALTNDAVQVKIVENGAVAITIAFVCNAPGVNRFERQITLYAESNEVVIENTIDKKAIREKESLHFGFPFRSSLNQVTLDAGYGTIKYLADQLPGSNKDYLYTRNWLDLSQSDKGIQWMVQEAPLLEPGSMIDERRTIYGAHKEWKSEGNITSTWFSYIMNNYWHTNYKADQDGVSSYRYCLKPHGMFSNSETEKAAIVFSAPLQGWLVKEEAALPGSLFELSNARIVVTSVTPLKEGGYTIRLFNPEPAAEQTNFRWGKLRPSQLINSQNGKIMAAGDSIMLPGQGVIDMKLVP
ncbi:glycoside hydrolase [Niastella vici]|uniref:Glycoside hydrolase n=1 Tax=Niastella vici TaxID=1703345 RepID=A0A1V9G020_9BACT|nr:glycoside hydrolase family 38 C-terminal domain-containing protein [Niastella vici]OQP63914.1 glycoside hydrolase [Niastella vici]